jgi:hypothetical protein
VFVSFPFLVFYCPCIYIYCSGLGISPQSHSLHCSPLGALSLKGPLSRVYQQGCPPAGGCCGCAGSAICAGCTWATVIAACAIACVSCSMTGALVWSVVGISGSDTGEATSTSGVLSLP